MQKLILLTSLCALLACSDSKQKADAGDDGNTGDVDAGETSAGELERAPGSLPRPPSKKLPDDLKPPGFAK